MLGPSAGEDLWHKKDVLGRFEWHVGGQTRNYILRDIWKAKSDAERAVVLKEVFGRRHDPSGNEALTLLGIILKQENGPRLYWADLADDLLDAMGNEFRLGRCQSVRATETFPSAIKLRLTNGGDRVFDLGTLVLGMPPRVQELDEATLLATLTEGLLAHTHILAWGWGPDSLTVLRDLLPSQKFTGRLAVIDSVDRLAWFPYDQPACLPAGRVSSDGTGLKEEVLASLREVAGVSGRVDPTSSSAPAKGRLAGPDDGAESGSAQRTLVRAVAQRLGDMLEPHLQREVAVLGLVVEPGFIRSAVARSLEDRYPAALHVTIDTESDLEALDIADWPGPAADMAVVQASTPVSEAMAVDHAARLHRKGRPPFRLVVLMPAPATAWDSSRDVALESARTAVSEAVRSAAREALNHLGRPALERRVGAWLVGDGSAVGMECRLGLVGRLLAAEDPDRVTETLAQLVRKVAAARVRLAARPRPTIRLKPRPPSDEPPEGRKS